MSIEHNYNVNRAKLKCQSNKLYVNQIKKINLDDYQIRMTISTLQTKNNLNFKSQNRKVSVFLKLKLNLKETGLKYCNTL